MIVNGSTVAFEYTLTLADGSLVKSNVGQEPFRYVHGEVSFLPALQAVLVGHVVNDEIKIRLSPEEAYGPVKPDLFKDVPIDQIPEQARTVGAMLQVSGAKGSMRVHAIREDTVVLDFNHPLAGKELNFEIRILSVSSGHGLNGRSR